MQWYKVDNAAAVTIVTEEVTEWCGKVAKMREPWSRDLCNIIDTTQGIH